MALFDKPLADLQSYWPEVPEPADFDHFWQQTVREAREHDLDVQLDEVDNRLGRVQTFDVSFAGFGGDRIRAWLHLPVGVEGPLPTVVEFHGYSGGRGMPVSVLWAAAGYATLTVDTRGQGWGLATTFPPTPDPAAGVSGVPGVMTSGILDPATYSYRRIFTDCFRALEAARSLEPVDSSKIFVKGGSQGGGMTIAAAGLAGLHDLPLAGALPDVPFLCHFDRAIELTDAHPYKEVSDYLKGRPHDLETVLTTLSYHDGVNFARRAACPTLFSVGMMDLVCPPSTVYAAFNHWADTDQTIMVYPHNGHEGGRDVHVFEQLGWVRDRLSERKVKPKRPRRGMRRG